jgi:transcriptional regulator with XRE-family HTH domain
MTERHFGNRLRESRLAAGLSQSELEDISGIPKARLSRYENGHVEPSIQTLNRLARALNVSEASLLGDERAAMEEFFAVLAERGITISTKSEARDMAERFADQTRSLSTR